MPIELVEQKGCRQVTKAVENSWTITGNMAMSILCIHIIFYILVAHVF